MLPIDTKPTPKERALEGDSKHKTIASRVLEVCWKSNIQSQHEWTIAEGKLQVQRWDSWFATERNITASHE